MEFSRPSSTASQQPTSGFPSKYCNTCAAGMESADHLRAHAKTEWHLQNLKRRVSGLEPLDAESAATPAELDAGSESEQSDIEDSQSGEISSTTSTSAEYYLPLEEVPEFNPTKCLFCSTTSESFDDNWAHMQKTHGLLIPDADNLATDLETLTEHLHLLIFWYNECLSCRAWWGSAEAVQHHMLAKGHCRLEVAGSDSEFSDFYDFDSAKSEDGDIGEHALQLQDPDGTLARLPSGKIVSHRSSAPARRHSFSFSNAARALGVCKEAPRATFRPGSAPKHGGTDFSPGMVPFEDAPLTRQEKRGDTLDNLLASLRITDREALAHLPPSEQRAILMTQRDQADKARRIEQRYRSRLEMLNNKTLMKHFTNDVPGRANG
ncbi:hypothetical protein MFIFM68171_04790 [Madurella fahalii]|uniref:U1-type domain-containing protein n=1 Tax=Madurella fahalii TaxID=1157608 RepID=A0ABQ0GAH5_9PEZI